MKILRFNEKKREPSEKKPKKIKKKFTLTVEVDAENSLEAFREASKKFLNHDKDIQIKEN